MPALIGSENAGDFHDWPESWQRSSDASENSWTGAVYHCKTWPHAFQLPRHVCGRTARTVWWGGTGLRFMEDSKPARSWKRRTQPRIGLKQPLTLFSTLPLSSPQPTLRSRLRTSAFASVGRLPEGCRAEARRAKADCSAAPLGSPRLRSNPCLPSTSRSQKRVTYDAAM